MKLALGYPIDDLDEQFSDDHPARLGVPRRNRYRPLSGQDDTAASAMLAALQANIIQAHVRDHARFLVLKFGPDYQKNRSFVGAASRFVKSAFKHRLELIRFQSRKDGETEKLSEPTEPLVNLMLSANGYRGLNRSPPAGAAFRRGMSGPGRLAGDGDPAGWQSPWKRSPASVDAVDAVLLIAGAGDMGSAVDGWSKELLRIASDYGVVLLGEEYGHCRGAVLENDGKEPFGFTDGLSQPLYFTSQILRSDSGGVHSSKANLSTLLVDEGDGISFGSYAVFRKLEQHVEVFQNALSAMVAQGIDADEAAAALVGRFKDGSPLIRFDRPSGSSANNFDYADDQDGVRCPVAAHIRKMNHRGSAKIRVDNPDGSWEEIAVARPVLARRGMPYDESRYKRKAADQSTGVGLLFLAFQHEIDAQFLIMQSWADSADFPKAGAGRDLLTGGGSTLDRRGNQMKTQRFVTFKGGEYLYAPSLTFLKSFAPPD